MAAGSILQGRNSDEIISTQSIALDKKAGRKKHDPDGPMKITAIKQQIKRAGRYSIFVNDTYAFSLSEGALLDQKIYNGQEVTPEQLAAFKDTSAFDKAYGNTLAYVARRLRSEWELRDYFRRKDVDEETGQQIVDRLRGFGYVSDQKFAESWVANRRAVKPVSRRRLTQELKQKRVSDDVITIVLEADETSDEDTLRQLIHKKRQQSRYQDHQKLMQYLARQGYQYDAIKQLLGEEAG